VWKELGVTEPTVEARMVQYNELKAPTKEGYERRKRLQEASHDFHGLGIKMNRRYQSGAIYVADEKKVRLPLPRRRYS
jgi:hypothetical protein